MDFLALGLAVVLWHVGAASLRGARVCRCIACASLAELWCTSSTRRGERNALQKRGGQGRRFGWRVLLVGAI